MRIAERVAQDFCFVLVAVQADQLIGMIEVRNYNHIALLFVDDEHQRQGIASSLLEVAIEKCREKNATLRRITVNASPYGLSFFHWANCSVARINANKTSCKKKLLRLIMSNLVLKRNRN